MTDQEIFDFVVNHLRKQGEPAVEIDSFGRVRCRYRIVKDGKALMCAAGCIVPDSKYDPSIEGEAWDMICEKLGMPEHEDLICSLQDCHDGWAESLDEMLGTSLEARLEKTAKSHGLVYTPPE